MTVQGRVQSFIDKARQPHVICTLAIAVILFIVLLQFSVIYVRQQSVSSDISQDGMSELTVTEEAPLVPTAPAPTQEAPLVPIAPALTETTPLVPTAPALTETTPIAPKITYLFNNTDPGVSTRPADMVDFATTFLSVVALRSTLYRPGEYASPDIPSKMGALVYQNLFDLSIGSPTVIMDIILPLYGFTNKAILKLANIPPSFPLDKKPDHYAAMLVHNCWVKNNRKDLMQALIDKAGTHSYGECLNNKEVLKGLGNDEVDQGIWMLKKLKILSGYPFVFAAENSNCMGYVTEKIYNVLEVGAIPIYMGASDIADFVPKGNYVDVSKFKNFDEVVEYIKTVDRSQFYKWKEVVKKDPSKFCRSCFKPTVSAMCSVIDRVRFMDNTLP
ncbi:4-alpha-L-fucosyltransferase [Mortierella antarctica]|nr:4-alpha-L-fucosyltransferase [Mortierella antarctica]